MRLPRPCIGLTGIRNRARRRQLVGFGGGHRIENECHIAASVVACGVHGRQHDVKRIDITRHGLPPMLTCAGRCRLRREALTASTRSTLASLASQYAQSTGSGSV
jgi:hypothetical protein